MSFLINCLIRMSCIKMDLIDNNKDKVIIQKIKDNFITPIILKDGDKIEFKGKILGICKYYLFEHNDKKYYIKKSSNNYGICESTDELYDNNYMSRGVISKIPSQDKLKKSYENINQNKNVYLLEDGLKISHINSTFTQLDKFGKQTVATFEYLLSSDDGFVVLSYNYVHGLSIVNVNL